MAFCLAIVCLPASKLYQQLHLLVAGRNTAIKAETVLNDGWGGHVEEKRILGLQDWTACSVLQMPLHRVSLAEQSKKVSASWALRAALSPVGFFPQRIAQGVHFLEKSEWQLDYKTVVAQLCDPAFCNLSAACNPSACLADPFSIISRRVLCPRSLTPSGERAWYEGSGFILCPPCSATVSVGSCDDPHLCLLSGGPFMLQLSPGSNTTFSSLSVLGEIMLGATSNLCYRHLPPHHSQ